MILQDAEEIGPGAENMQFTLLQGSGSLGPRLGRLTIQGRRSIETPHYVGLTSRGVLPHISQDVMQKHTRITGIYVALEDFIERASVGQTPPIFSHQKARGTSALRSFISLADDQLLILGCRRIPPVVSPWPNSQTEVSVSTSFGFGKIKAEDYASAATALDPDIVVALGDIPFGERAGQRRLERMSWRTEKWMGYLVNSDISDKNNNQNPLIGKIFAPVLPISKQKQSLYMDMLVEDWRHNISGLAVYDADILGELPEPLVSLPKLSMTGLKKPEDLLKEVSLGMDILTIPFLGQAADLGIALDFRFPATADPSFQTGDKPLGLDMLAPEHAADLSPLVDQCDCYACSVHHRAYVHHLLSANEMLAWVLLQIHNIRVMDNFFDGIRASIKRETFEQDHQAFLKVYQRDLPRTEARGPRIRGYQVKSEGPGESKKNPKAYNTLDAAKEANAEAPLPSPNANAEDLKAQGFAEIANHTKQP